MYVVPYFVKIESDDDDNESSMDDNDKDNDQDWLPSSGDEAEFASEDAENKEFYGIRYI